MPIYEYRCRSCGAELEVLRKFSDAPLRKCRECGGRLDKVISRTSFHLKGGGWFAQGYSDKPGKKGAKSPAGERGGKQASDSSGSKKPAGKKAAGDK